MPAPGHDTRWFGRRTADYVLFGVTAVELGLLFYLSPSFQAVDWIYVTANLLVLLIALSRRDPDAQDTSLGSSFAVLVSYTYSYAQVALLHWYPGEELWPDGAVYIVLIGAVLSLLGLLSLGRFFGARPAHRGLSTRGSYRFVRHPIYAAYLIQDIGYNLDTWSIGTLALVAVGWASLVYRIIAEERVLSQDTGWPAFTARVRYRVIPGVW